MRMRPDGSFPEFPGFVPHLFSSLPVLSGGFRWRFPALPRPFWKFPVPVWSERYLPAFLLSDGGFLPVPARSLHNRPGFLLLFSPAARCSSWLYSARWTVPGISAAGNLRYPAFRFVYCGYPPWTDGFRCTWPPVLSLSFPVLRSHGGGQEGCCCS